MIHNEIEIISGLRFKYVQRFSRHASGKFKVEDETYGVT